jgi:hypothetical protein
MPRYIAEVRIRTGTDTFREVGEEVPEAQGWAPHVLQPYLNLGRISRAEPPVEPPKPKRKYKKRRKKAARKSARKKVARKPATVSPPEVETEAAAV